MNDTLPKNDPVPLTDPEGRVRAYACPRCFRVRVGVEAGGPDGCTVELEWSKDNAERCGRCRECGAEISDGHGGWKSRCAACELEYKKKTEAEIARDRPIFAARAAARDLALQRAKDVDCARLLVDRMGAISEESYCAGWMVNNEHALWSMVIGGDRCYGFNEVSTEDVEELRRLSHRADGWFYWSDELHGEVFIPTAEWKIRHQQHMEGRDARNTQDQE